MVFYQTTPGPVFKLSTKLDHLLQKKKICLFLYLKWFRLVDHPKTKHKCQVLEWLWQPSCFTYLKAELDFFLAKLDCFIKKKNVFMSQYISKMVKSSGPFKNYTNMSHFYSLVLECLVPAKMDHL
jgi:hypothetical protein